jgi:tRNA modification GTPase
VDRTIFAQSSAPGRAGIAVIRISGPDAGAALRQLTRRAYLPAPRRATLAELWPSADAAGALDRALVLWFPAPHSYTGEDVAELHVHGGRAVVVAVLEALAALPGLAPAEPGAFTRRAFDNGRLDLTRVEGLADLIDAETEQQRRQALSQYDGALGRLYEEWRARLVQARALVEAEIDFADQGLPGGLAMAAAEEVRAVDTEIARHLADRRRGERLRSGVQVAILGPPNAGKSSLLNRLAGRDAAIVSAEAGTTRDVIEVHLDLDGYPVTVADTAGLRAAAAGVEAEGVARARGRAAAADVRLVIFDVREGAGAADALADLVDDAAIVLANKVDLAPLPPGTVVRGQAVLGVSVRTGEGLDAALDMLTARVRSLIGTVSDRTAPTRPRHRQALERCREALNRALAAPLPDLAAEDLRLASRALGTLTGHVDVEEVLDEIFRAFCIGK